MARIKKAQQGISCRWSRGERTPLRERVANVKSRISDALERSRERKQERKQSKASPAKEGGYERDFPSDASPGGFKGDPGGKKGTRWADDRETKIVGSMKKGGKVKVRKAQTGIKATRITEKPGVPSSRRKIDYSVDTTGYAAGKKKFPATKRVSGNTYTTQKETTVGRGKVKSFIKKPIMSRVNTPKKKLGGKLAKQAATAIAMKKQGIKPKKSK